MLLVNSCIHQDSLEDQQHGEEAFLWNEIIYVAIYI